MSRDYAHRSRSKKPSDSRRTPWIVFIIVVVLVALLVFGLAFINHHFKPKEPVFPEKGGAPVEQAKPASASAIKPKTTQKKTPAAPKQAPVKFDFYNVLPKMKVSTTIEVPEAESSQYVLQLGSFNSEQSAQALQKEVRQKGFRTFIFTAFIGNQAWYRVQMGPYKNQDMAETERNKLQDAKTPSVLVAV